MSEYETNKDILYLYQLHENERMSTTEKIEEITEKYSCFQNKQNWDTLNNFFKHPIYTRTSYWCVTSSNFGNGAQANKYLYTDVSREDELKGNVYFYILLSILGCVGEKDIWWHTSGLLSWSNRTDLYLKDYEKAHGLLFDKRTRNPDWRFIQISMERVESHDGHDIYKSIELPI